ncbi:MAG: hypothetical protein ACE5FO_09170 [Parvularculaceae bacterium]
MLRNLSQVRRRARRRPNFNIGGVRRQALARRAAIASVVVGAVVSGAVAADTLAQPRQTPLERRAADYILFREDVAAIEAEPLNSAASTREAHKRLGAHDSYALSGGWVAYAALVAADTPEFAEALQKELRSKKRRGRRGLSGKDAFLARLAADPSYPRKLNGAKAAMKAVLEMTARDSARFADLGATFKTQAYAMQKTKWGKQRIQPGSKRLSEAARYATSRPAARPPTLAPATDHGVTAPSLASAEPAWSPGWGQSAAPGRISEPNAQVVMDRVLNLAARYAIDGVNEKVVEVYAKNDHSERCLSLSKLTLNQCIAATRTPYEEAFCLGEHGLNDVATCIGWVAGAGAS